LSRSQRRSSDVGESAKAASIPENTGLIEAFNLEQRAAKIEEEGVPGSHPNCAANCDPAKRKVDKSGVSSEACDRRSVSAIKLSA
jgi:hypothetical protein